MKQVLLLSLGLTGINWILMPDAYSSPSLQSSRLAMHRSSDRAEPTQPQQIAWSFDRQPWELDWGAPNWSYGGAARGGCRPTEDPLVPLMPVNVVSSSDPTRSDMYSAFLSTTMADYPSFFIYVPPTIATAVDLLIVDEENGEVVYQSQPYSLNGEAGIVEFTLSDAVAAHPLEMDRTYTWSFSVICDPLNPSTNPFVSGRVRRISSDSNWINRIAEQDPRDRPSLYAEGGVWHETIKSLADLRCEYPNDDEIRIEWANLLESMELNDIPELFASVQPQAIAQAPLLQCQTSN